MFLFPSSGFGRFLVIFLTFATIVSLILNLVSFGGNPWINYFDVPIRFGLWEVCQTDTNVFCFQWSDDLYLSPIINSTFPNRKPSSTLLSLFMKTDHLCSFSLTDFIRSSQALEIISLIFYVAGTFFIIGGLVIGNRSLEKLLFLSSSILLFICSSLKKYHR